MMDNGVKEVVTKQLKYYSKRERGEENQNLKDLTAAKNFGKIKPAVEIEVEI